MSSQILIAQWSPLFAVAFIAFLFWLGAQRIGKPRSPAQVPSWLKDWFLWWTSPCVSALVKIKGAPTGLNAAGLGFSVVAGILYGRGDLALAGWVLLLAGLCDTLDGRVARAQDVANRRGAFIDSVLDRYSEIALYAGLAWWFQREPGLWWCGLALLSSLMVSYSRARAEGLGLALKDGLMQRPQRLAILILCSIFSPIGLFFGENTDGAIIVFFVALIAILSSFTAVQRFFMAVRDLGKEDY